MDYQAAAISLRAIATGIMSLADALEIDSPTASDTPPSRAPAASDSNAPESDAAPSSGRRGKAKTDKAPSEEVEDERDEFDLGTIQAMGRDLLAAGKRSELRAILERFNLPNLSSAKPKQFADLHTALKEAIATE